MGASSISSSVWILGSNVCLGLKKKRYQLYVLKSVFGMGSLATVGRIGVEE